MKIAMLTPDYYPNFYAGVGVHVYSLVQSLCKLDGIEIVVFVVRCEGLNNGVPHIFEDPSGIKIYEFEAKEKAQESLDFFTYRWVKNNLSAVEYISTILEDQHFDIIHCHDMFPIGVMDLLRRKLEIPVIATIHARSTGEDKIEDAMRGFLCRTADYCIAISNQLSNELKERYGSIEVNVIHNGITKSNNNQKIGKQRYITFCGRIIKLKGVDVLIRAFSQIICDKEMNDIKLIIMGNGDYRTECETLVKELNLENNVEFKGNIQNSEVRKIISRSMIHIVPSLYEGFATSALEAMEEGTAVLATATGGIKEMITDKVNGVTVPPDDDITLTNKLLFLLNNRGIRNEIEKNAKVYVGQFYWEKIATRISEIYKQLLK